jgi:hypothetical protein
LKSPTVLAVLAALDAFLMAYGHYPIIRVISSVPQIGGYFLFATVVYVLGGIFLLANRLFKLSIFGLIVLAIVDDLLLVYTRTTATNIFFHHIVPWSYGWYPLGTVQVLVGQTVLIVLCAVLYRTGKPPTK